MRAVQFAAYGSPDVLHLVNTPMPEPRADEVRIRVIAAGINPADYKWRSGMFRDRVPIQLPHTLGSDVAGWIDAVGEAVDDFSIGDPVFAKLDPVTKGGHAEFALAHRSWVARLPEGLDPAVAATLPTPALTGMQLIEEHIRPEPGQTVLVTGAVGAVGRFAVFAARPRDVRVIAAVRPSQIEAALALGAAEAIVLDDKPPADLWFDHVADTVGGPDVAALCRRLRQGGRIITVATTPIDPEGLLAKPVFMAVRPDGAALARIAGWVVAKSITVPPLRAFPLGDASEAHRLLEAGAGGIKLVLKP